MIIKNEEKLLPQCLESIKDVVDEIVIVDTGLPAQPIRLLKSPRAMAPRSTTTPGKMTSANIETSPFHTLLETGFSSWMVMKK
jgi:hypothetical protein